MPVKLLMTSCQSTTDIVAIHGVDKRKFTAFRSYELDAGVLEAFRTDKSGALVGSKIAGRYGWRASESVTLEELRGISFTVRGVFSVPGRPEDFLILVGRRFLQEATDKQGISNQVLVKLESGAHAPAVCEAVESLPLATEVSCEMEEAFLAASLDQLKDLASVSRMVIVTIVVVTLIAMGNAISIATRERAGEIGILRTLGFQKGAVLRMMMLEGLIQTLAGGLAGCLLVEALVRGGLIRSGAKCGPAVQSATGPWAWGGALAGIVVAGTLGSLVPAWNLSRVDIVEAIRRED